MDIDERGRTFAPYAKFSSALPGLAGKVLLFAVFTHGGTYVGAFLLVFSLPVERALCSAYRLRGCLLASGSPAYIIAEVTYAPDGPYPGRVDDGLDLSFLAEPLCRCDCDEPGRAPGVETGVRSVLPSL